MHTIKLGNFTINFNSDFSGEIIVHQENGRGFAGSRQVAEIPFMVMAAVVGEKLRRERMDELDVIDPLAAYDKLVLRGEKA